jgi:branched-chain amino acid transport system ATP-binding protein
VRSLPISRPSNASMNTLLSVRKLSKAFGAIRIATNIDFDVGEREILGVIGPNGAGKTTLFGMLSGQIKPSAGRLHFCGADITELPPHERARAGIARTYQIPRPFGQMTVLDNLHVAAHFSGNMSREKTTEWITEVLAITGLRPHADTPAGRLTLLLRKRHELARALAMRPKLLLIDEVAAGLTQEEVSEFIELVRLIRGMGTGIVWVEHVIRTMLTATDRLMVLDGGEILAVGDPHDVINRPEVKRVYLGA